MRVYCTSLPVGGESDETPAKFVHAVVLAWVRHLVTYLQQPVAQLLHVLVEHNMWHMYMTMYAHVCMYNNAFKTYNSETVLKFRRHHLQY